MHFRPATSEDIPIVADILSAAAADLQVRGLALWSLSDIGVSVITPHVLGGLYHVGLEGGVAVGVFRLEAADPVFWPEMAAGSAVYLHKLAVHPARQGQGCAHRLLTHAVTLARDRGAGFLRLDCMGGRPKLRRVYKVLDFAITARSGWAAAPMSGSRSPLTGTVQARPMPRPAGRADRGPECCPWAPGPAGEPPGHRFLSKNRPYPAWNGHCLLLF